VKRFFLLAAFWLSSLPAQAHSVALSVLSVQQVSAQDFVLSWQRLEGLHDQKAAFLVLKPRFPEHCTLSPPRLHCEGKGLTGRIVFEGLGTHAGATAVVNFRWLDAPPSSRTFTAASPVAIVEAKQTATPLLRLAAAYTSLGLWHIWLGWDHLAFVLGLLWLVKTRAMLVQTITAFTVAHSLTLAVATLGMGTLPVPPVEAVIALSIAFLALELVQQRRDGVPGLAGRAPFMVAFGFGLLHGFGFASALREAEIPAQDLTVALVFFNFGVELGQLVFVGAAAFAGRLLRRASSRLVEHGEPIAHYALGAIAMYWFVERIVSFWPST
jgi:hydrogenase/urease accessory protein HupE